MSSGSFPGKNFAIVIMSGLVLVFLNPVFAQETPGQSRAEREKYRLNETEIRGELRDALGTLRLRESEIIGSLERPRLSYSLPWKEADLNLEPDEEPEADLLGESYPFMDPGRLGYDPLNPQTGNF